GCGTGVVGVASPRARVRDVASGLLTACVASTTWAFAWRTASTCPTAFVRLRGAVTGVATGLPGDGATAGSGVATTVPPAGTTTGAGTTTAAGTTTGTACGTLGIAVGTAPASGEP